MKKNVFLFVLMLVFFSMAACNSDEKEEVLPDIAFDREKWKEKKDGQYVFRKQMVQDILQNKNWEGMKKDTLLAVLGHPDMQDDGNLVYEYERKPFLGGLGTTLEAIVVEMKGDSVVKKVRLNDKGWD